MVSILARRRANRTGGSPGPVGGGDALPRRRARRGAVVAALTVTVAAALVVAACGGGAAGTSSSPTVPGSSTAYRWGVVGNKGAIQSLELHVPTVVTGTTGRIVQIATSNSDGYALTSGGAVYGWGVNSYGELGDGHTTPYETRAVKVAFPPGVHIVALADPMPFDAAMAIDATGHVWGWGLDGDHDLCLSPLVLARPVRIPLSGVSLASGARTHALFDAGGTVYSCGSGDAGELGTGSLAPAATPAPVMGLPAGERVTALTSSWEGSGALLADGTYYNWGYNAAGQLGDGTIADSAVPVRVHLSGRVVDVFQGGSGPNNGQTVALLADRSTWAWGNNDRGQLGTGTRVDAVQPVRVQVPSGTTFVRVASGGYASYGIDTRGRLWAWGDNRSGQLGTGSAARTALLPVDVGLHLAAVSSTAQNVAGYRSG